MKMKRTKKRHQRKRRRRKRTRKRKNLKTNQPKTTRKTIRSLRKVRSPQRSHLTKMSPLKNPLRLSRCPLRVINPRK